MCAKATNRFWALYLYILTAKEESKEKRRGIGVVDCAFYFPSLLFIKAHATPAPCVCSSLRSYTRLTTQDNYALIQTYTTPLAPCSIPWQNFPLKKKKDLTRAKMILQKRKVLLTWWVASFHASAALPLLSTNRTGRAYALKPVWQPVPATPYHKLPQGLPLLLFA